MTDENEVVKSIKGFDKDLKCRGFQFEVGKTYEADGDIIACKNGFHAIEGHPLEVFAHYSPGANRYAEVVQSGKIARHSEDSKIASAKITIGVEIHLHDLIQRAVKWVFDRAKPEGTGSSATGWQGAASATGEYGAASATGWQGKVMGADGCALFLVYRNQRGDIMHAWGGIAGRNGIKSMTWYTLNSDGNPEEVS